MRPLSIAVSSSACVLALSFGVASDLEWLSAENRVTRAAKVQANLRARQSELVEHLLRTEERVQRRSTLVRDQVSDTRMFAQSMRKVTARARRGLATTANKPPVRPGSTRGEPVDTAAVAVAVAKTEPTPVAFPPDPSAEPAGLPRMPLHTAARLLQGGEEGIREWNQWRASGGRIPHLIGLALYETHLVDVNFTDANLIRANLTGANLTGANLTGANLKSANCYGTNFKRATLNGTNFADANLRGARLQGAALKGAHLTSAILYGAQLQSADLTDANLYLADLRRARLRGATLSGALLEHAENLIGSQLKSACGDGRTRLPKGLFVARCQGP